MKTILAAVDSSSTSALVVATAANLARNVHSRVVLLTIIQPPIITSEFAPPIENLTEIMAATERAAARHLQTCEQRLQADGIASESMQLSGSPVAHILEQAEKSGADFIVMGSHGHTALYDLLVGSTTHGVLLRAPCPVVVVPPPKKAAGKTKTRAP